MSPSKKPPSVFKVAPDSIKGKGLIWFHDPLVMREMDKFMNRVEVDNPVAAKYYRMTWDGDEETAKSLRPNAEVTRNLKKIIETPDFH